MFFSCVCVCDDKVYLLLYVFVTLLLVTNPLNLFNNKLKPRVINPPIYHPPQPNHLILTAKIFSTFHITTSCHKETKAKAHKKNKKMKEKKRESIKKHKKKDFHT